MRDNTWSVLHTKNVSISVTNYYRRVRNNSFSEIRTYGLFGFRYCRTVCWLFVRRTHRKAASYRYCSPTRWRTGILFANQRRNIYDDGIANPTRTTDYVRRNTTAIAYAQQFVYTAVVGEMANVVNDVYGVEKHAGFRVRLFSRPPTREQTKYTLSRLLVSEFFSRSVSIK